MEGWLFYSLIVLLGFLIWYFIYKQPLWVVLFLILLLPFHAFLVTSLGYFLNLDSIQSLVLSFWKEFIIISFLLKTTYKSLTTSKLPFKFLWFDYLIFGLFILSLVVNYIQDTPTLITAYGLRYDFLMFAVYFVFRSLNFTDEELMKIVKAFMWTGVVVVLFGLLQKLLSADFLTNFGYAGVTDWNPKNLLSLPSYSYIHETNTQRLQSFFSGPNALASYLVILWGLNLFNIARARIGKGLIFYVIYLLAIGALLYLTYSRSAWIAVILITILFILSLFKEWRTKILIIIILLCSGVIGVLTFGGNLSENILRTNSSLNGHMIRNAAAVYLIKNNPEGLGVGTAGPSSLRFEQSSTKIPTKAYPEIESYLNKINIKSNPSSYHFILKDSLVPENWFLQIGVEMGILGLTMFIAIVLGIFWSMYFLYTKAANHFHKEFILICLFIGVGLVTHSLFLHTWSDAPTTILYWVLVGVVFSTNREVFNEKN